ncbi:RNA-guided endonuclease TnpB family protein [Actinomadura meridiana]|uniref:RNA-guided endonuclease TnpB family protein n=1 Tax=Actinomadura meridiana TaxID=559626 RepID=A0ABP8CM66_9ACTN
MSPAPVDPASPEQEKEPGSARFTYRARLSATAERLLLAEWDRDRWVWNMCVETSKKGHAHNRAHPGNKQTCGPARLCRELARWRAEHAWLRRGSSVPQQQIIRDFATSRAKALKDIKDRIPMRKRAGMPKFKAKGRARPSLNYNRQGFRLKTDDQGRTRVHLAGGIVVRPVWSRALPADPSSVRVYQDSLGHWYLSFVVPTQVRELPETGAVIGVDWGVSEVATTTSDAHDLPHPEFGKKAADRLARYQRQMARRRAPKGKKATKGYLNAKHHAAKAHRKVARQRQDHARKWAKNVMVNHDRIAVEDFKPKFLATTTMARKAADAAIGATKAALIEMGRKHGRDIRLTHPAYTTMDCAACGARTKHRLPLGERTYTCIVCGVSRPRDKNSAHVMLVRAGFVPATADRTGPARPPDEKAA